jgi:glycosyltransferase involved in cell wall biosynthesis
VRIDQVLVGAAPGDAITSMALQIRRALRTVTESDIYALHLEAPLVGDVERIERYEARGPDDVLIYHASFGEPELTSWLTTRHERLVLVYHNITPAAFFAAIDGHTAARLAWGREELVLLRRRVVAAFADSAYNARELEALGYPDVTVLPVGVDPSRILYHPGDGAIAAYLDREIGAPFVLSVGQLLPHKRPDLVVQAYHVLRAHLGVDAGLVLVGAHRNPAYAWAMTHLVHDLGLDRIWLAGPVPDAGLATLYRRAAVYVTASEHEGLCIPPLEAMAFGVPVVARAFAALPDTIGPAGLLLPPESGAVMLGEAMAEVLSNGPLAKHLVDAGLRRIRAFDPTDHLARFVARLAEVL